MNYTLSFQAPSMWKLVESGLGGHECLTQKQTGIKKTLNLGRLFEKHTYKIKD